MLIVGRSQGRRSFIALPLNGAAANACPRWTNQESLVFVYSWAPPLNCPKKPTKLTQKKLGKTLPNRPRTIVIALLLMLGAIPALAQSTGTILGVVKDTSGAVVPESRIWPAAPPLAGPLHPH